MAADLHIHVLEGCSEQDIMKFFSNTMGSKHFDLRMPRDHKAITDPDDLWARVSESPNIWIGEVSWLKAALTGDSDTFVPTPVQQIHDVIGEELPMLDEALEAKILEALALKNDTGYDVTKQEEVKTFLKEHRGKRLFTVSW